MITDPNNEFIKLVKFLLYVFLFAISLGLIYIIFGHLIIKAMYDGQLVGLLNNVIRVIPNKLCLNIDLTKIKIKPIFKWLKKNKITDSEMLKTFNCGIGFCLITSKKNVKKIKKVFSKKYQPYQIGFISNEKSKIKTYGKLEW